MLNRSHPPYRSAHTNLPEVCVLAEARAVFRVARAPARRMRPLPSPPIYFTRRTFIIQFPPSLARICTLHRVRLLPYSPPPPKKERMVLKHERFSAWPERRLDVCVPPLARISIKQCDHVLYSASRRMCPPPPSTTSPISLLNRSDLFGRVFPSLLPSRGCRVLNTGLSVLDTAPNPSPLNPTP